MQVFATSISIPWWELNGGDWPSATVVIMALVFASLSIFMLFPSMYRALQLWRRGRQSRVDTAKDYASDYESYRNSVDARNQLPQSHEVVQEVQTTEDRRFDVKSTRSSRPLSETTACWSDASGDATLNRPSTLFSEKRPPSYVSPLPSRAPTTVHRKPLN